MDEANIVPIVKPLPKTKQAIQPDPRPNRAASVDPVLPSQAAKPKPRPVANEPLISSSAEIKLPEINGGVDYLAAINYDTFIVGSTIGQVAIYNATDGRFIKMLNTGGL